MDIFIVVFFLIIALLGLELFRRDLLQTFRLQNVEPVGTVIVKRNVVQRRLTDRAIWDRLSNESPVYIGDLIRVADISAATLNINENSIDIDENTLIRITRSADGEGIQINLSEGSISLASEQNSKSITIDLNGQQVQTAQGTVMSAAVKDNKQSIQVNEGTVQFAASSGVTRQISAGSLVNMDINGAERLDRAVVVTRPFPNVRYIKNSPEPVQINFSWNRINLEQNQLLRLEISSSGNFSNITNTVNNLNRNITVTFDAGLWFWRILFQNEVLSTGQLTVADGTGTYLISPAFNSIFKFKEGDDYPVLNFQWRQVNEAVSYVMEISNTSNFSNTQMQIQGSSTSQVISGLHEGIWYWRVKAVFPSVYNGSASFSPPAFFRIEKTASSYEDASSSSENLSQWLATQTPSAELPLEVPPEIIPVRITQNTYSDYNEVSSSPDAVNETTASVPPQENIPAPLPPLQITLGAPANGAQIAGLTALRQPTTFQWSTTTPAGQIVSSRFVLSRNANPLQGTPARTVSNPMRTLNISNLEEGIWYWTVEIRTQDGRTASALPRRVQILPVPLLPSANNLQPPNSGRIGFAQLQSQRSIIFRWSQVQGANAYIFTLSQQTGNTRRQIIRTTINNETSYTINNMRLLDRGAFVWQVEPLFIRGSTIEQRGTIGESTFIIDVPAPSPIQIEDTGILYGN
ncbi:MAG: hypothetical protein FWB86_05375 [Treponema sp.]|nr:hypothetical protein [Treponema sp.]